MFSRARQRKLYRLLRDDENPLEYGIIAKRPFANDSPLVHIRNGSQRNSQWISTSKDLSAVDNFIKRKRKMEGICACRVVEIDEQMLQTGLLLPYNAVSKVTTGNILDFTDPVVMDTYIPVNHVRARGYARKYKEVLVERFIPPECCIAIHYR